jgi:hypothetical protein
MIFNLFKRITEKLKGFFSSTYIVAQVEDEPDTVDSKTLYVIGEGDFLAFVVMLCPCGCNKKIHLNLMPGNKPTWSLSKLKGVPTLRPSIWRKVGCNSHFFIREGKVVWAKSI